MNKQDALIRLSSLENEAKELRKIIETADESPKPTAKEWLLNFLSQDFTVKFTKRYITYYLGDQWVYQQDFKNRYLWCYYYKVWEVFEKEYSMNYQQIQALQREVVGEALNCKEFTFIAGLYAAHR